MANEYLDFSDLELPKATEYPEHPLAVLARHHEKARRRRRQKLADQMADETQRLQLGTLRRQAAFLEMTRPYEYDEKVRARRKAIREEQEAIRTEPWRTERAESPVTRQKVKMDQWSKFMSGTGSGLYPGYFTPQEIQHWTNVRRRMSAAGQSGLNKLLKGQEMTGEEADAMNDPVLKNVAGIIRGQVAARSQTERLGITEKGKGERLGITEAGKYGRQGVTEEGKYGRLGITEEGKYGRQGIEQAWKTGESAKDRASREKIAAVRTEAQVLNQLFRQLSAKQPMGTDARHIGDVRKLITATKGMLGYVPRELAESLTPILEEEARRLVGMQNTPQGTAIANQVMMNLARPFQELMGTLDLMTGGGQQQPQVQQQPQAQAMPQPQAQAVPTGQPQVMPSGLLKPNPTPLNQRQAPGVVNALAYPQGAEQPYNFPTARAMQLAGQLASRLAVERGVPEEYSVGGQQYTWGPAEREQARRQYIQQAEQRQIQDRQARDTGWSMIKLGDETWVVPDTMAREMPGNVRGKRITRQGMEYAHNLARGGLFAKAVEHPLPQDYALATALLSGKPTKVGVRLTGKERKTQTAIVKKESDRPLKERLQQQEREFAAATKEQPYFGPPIYLPSPPVKSRARQATDLHLALLRRAYEAQKQQTPSSMISGRTTPEGYRRVTSTAEMSSGLFKEAKKQGLDAANAHLRSNPADGPGASRAGMRRFKAFLAQAGISYEGGPVFFGAKPPKVKLSPFEEAQRTSNTIRNARKQAEEAMKQVNEESELPPLFP